jgi:hypothetical protein
LTQEQEAQLAGHAEQTPVLVPVWAAQVSHVNWLVVSSKLQEAQLRGHWRQVSLALSAEVGVLGV